MKKLMLALWVFSFGFVACKKSEKKNAPAEKPAPQAMKPAVAPQPVKPAVKPALAAKTPCEKALHTLNSCLAKPKIPAPQAKALLAQCEAFTKEGNTLYGKDVACLAKAGGDCAKVEKCLPPKSKSACAIFADTRIKCRKKELKDALKADFRSFLTEECRIGMKARDKELMAIYACFKDAREVCVNSKACFKKLVALENTRDTARKSALDAKFKKLDTKGKALFAQCSLYSGRCVPELKSASKQDRELLVSSQCKFDLFSENAESKKKIACISKNAAAFKKDAVTCAVIDTCIKSGK